LTPLFKGPIPSQREGHTAVINKDKMVVFGGFDGKHTNQLFELDLSTMKWTEHKQTASTPVARYYHTAVKYKGKMYIFGGEDYRDSYVYFNFEIN
jgi:N-acetylneuraminic acid mutarotase